MESTDKVNGQSNRINANTVGAAKDRAAGAQAFAASDEVNALIADIRDLLGHITDLSDPGVSRLRRKVEEALSSTQAAIARGSERVQGQVKDALQAGDERVRAQPWQALGFAALAGLLIGWGIGRRSGPEDPQG